MCEREPTLAQLKMELTTRNESNNPIYQQNTRVPLGRDMLCLRMPGDASQLKQAPTPQPLLLLQHTAAKPYAPTIRHRYYRIYVEAIVREDATNATFACTRGWTHLLLSRSGLASFAATQRVADDFRYRRSGIKVNP